jgi:hypothetical protein
MKAMSRYMVVIAVVAVGVAIASAAAACTDEGEGDGVSSPTPGVTRTGEAAATAVPGVDKRAVLQGTLTIDGRPLEAEFLGVRVMRDGLVAACQAAIPAVSGGRYEIPVAADAEVRGCGAPGAQLILWAYVDGTYVYSNETAPWPGYAGSAKFHATFSTSAPAGASTRVTEVKGLLYERDGTTALPGGTVVEAYVGDTRCGVTSLRYGDVTEGYYTLIIAGPETVPACAEDAAVTFRLNGEPAVQTAVNDLGGSAGGHEVNLTLR